VLTLVYPAGRFLDRERTVQTMCHNTGHLRGVQIKLQNHGEPTATTAEGFFGVVLSSQC
jgi:hypothetical protein